jgi:hypothetical protein
MDQVQQIQRKECSDRDNRFGEEPLAWQICPDISAWLPAAREPQAAASQVGLEVAKGLAGNRGPQPPVRGDAGGFSERCVVLPACTGPFLRTTIPGTRAAPRCVPHGPVRWLIFCMLPRSYQKMRDSVSALEGLRQALKMAKLGSNVGTD